MNWWITVVALGESHIDLGQNRKSRWICNNRFSKTGRVHCQAISQYSNLGGNAWNLVAGWNWCLFTSGYLVSKRRQQLALQLHQALRNSGCWYLDILNYIRNGWNSRFVVRYSAAKETVQDLREICIHERQLALDLIRLVSERLGGSWQSRLRLCRFEHHFKDAGSYYLVLRGKVLGKAVTWDIQCRYNKWQCLICNWQSASVDKESRKVILHAIVVQLFLDVFEYCHTALRLRNIPNKQLSRINIMITVLWLNGCSIWTALLSAAQNNYFSLLFAANKAPR